jgi:hypothetical protein
MGVERLVVGTRPETARSVPIAAVAAISLGANSGTEHWPGVHDFARAAVDRQVKEAS